MYSRVGQIRFFFGLFKIYNNLAVVFDQIFQNLLVYFKAAVLEKWNDIFQDDEY